MDTGFVVAFNRDRDNYQVAAALAEAGELGRLVTDYYRGASRVVIPSLADRFSHSIDPALVESTPSAVVAQAAWLALRRQRPQLRFPVRFVDGAIGRHAGRVLGRRPGSSSLIYSGYAKYAWRAGRPGRRVLFQFHPGASLIRESLLDDELRSTARWLPEPEEHGHSSDHTFETELKLADSVLVASEYTRRSIRRLDCDTPVHVCPYGCPPIATTALDLRRSPRFLFIGQGVRRKGLHLLLEAWREAHLQDATLRIIASRMDPAIERQITASKNVSVSSRLSPEQLADELRMSDTLVLPSLVEGFGLVIGEALSAGCRVIATRNTGLPDYGAPSSVARVIEPGRVRPLADALCDFHSTFSASDSSYRVDAVAVAYANDWAAFRAQVRNALQVGVHPR